MTPDPELRIVMHTVGSRGTKFDAYPTHSSFAEEIVNVRYDADEDCVEQTRQWWAENAACETIVRACCVLDRDGETDFHVTYDPYASSVFRVHDRYLAHYAAREVDYPLGDAFRPMETRRLSTRSLDSLVRSQEVPAPDVLSMDTQGSEFKILTGGREIVAQSTVAVLSEVGMAEVYSGQKTFGDLHALLLDLGFELAELHYEGNTYAPFRAPLGARGKHEPLFADVLYLRRPDAAAERGMLFLCKLACVAAWLGHVELALAALSRAREQWDASLAEALEPFRYFRFLLEFETAAASLAEYPATFAETMTFEQSRERFAPAPERGRRPAYVRAFRAPLRALLVAAVRRRRRTLAGAAAAVENVFASHGLADIAELLRSKRMETAGGVTGSPGALLGELLRRPTR